jgi:hypothetical protein
MAVVWKPSKDNDSLTTTQVISKSDSLSSLEMETCSIDDRPILNLIPKTFSDENMSVLGSFPGAQEEGEFFFASDRLSTKKCFSFDTLDDTDVSVGSEGPYTNTPEKYEVQQSLDCVKAHANEAQPHSDLNCSYLFSIEIWNARSIPE